MPVGWLSDKDYDSIYRRIPRLCVDLVIKDPKGVLLSNRQIEPYKSFWHLPGGRVRFRESLSQAITRIAREETGLKVKMDKLLGSMEFLRETQNGRKRHTVSLVFMARKLSGQIKGSRQAQEVKYFKDRPKKMHPIHSNFLSSIFLWKNR